MGNPIPAPNPMGMRMGKKSPQLLNGDGDEKALPAGSRPVAIPNPGPVSLFSHPRPISLLSSNSPIL